MSAFLIDDQGRLWHADSPEIGPSRDGPQRARESGRHARSPRGAVQVTRAGRCYRIRFRPAEASEAAVAALAYHIADDRPARVILSWYDGVWHETLFSEWSRALARLFELSAGARRPRRDTFRHKRRPIRAVFRHPPLARLLARWRSLRPHFDLPSLEPLLRNDLWGRYIILEAGPDGLHLTFRAFGSGFFSYNETWVRTAPGLRLQDVPDYDYGAWVAEAYRAALAADAPRLDDVDAVVAVPRVGAMRFRYRRLILPFRESGRTPYLVGASVFDPTIDLRDDAR